MLQPVDKSLTHYLTHYLTHRGL